MHYWLHLSNSSMLDCIRFERSFSPFETKSETLVTKNTVIFSNMAKNNLMMSSDVETYKGSISGKETEKGAIIKYSIAWKNVDTSGRNGQVEVTSVEIDDSGSDWSFNYIGFSHSFSGAYTFNYTLKFMASKKLTHYSCPFNISGSCNMSSGK